MSETEQEAKSKNRRVALEAAARIMSEAKQTYGNVNAVTVLRMAEQFEVWLHRP